MLRQVLIISTALSGTETFLATGLTSVLAAVNSAIIIIREGVEAVLIIGAILSYMHAAGKVRRYTAWVYTGVVIAILLSLLTWWASLNLITISDANRGLIEGIASLIAVAAIFYVTNWLFHKVYVVNWMSFVKERVGRTLTTGSALTLAALSFTVVYREGFEVVLFYRTLLFDAGGMAVSTGFLVGLAVLLAIAYAILRLSKRMPLKPFFTITGLFLMAMAVNFTGAGIHELQEASVVTTTILPRMPANLVLKETLGVFPTWETCLAQLAFLVAIIVTFTYSHWRGRQVVAATAVRSRGGD